MVLVQALLLDRGYTRQWAARESGALATRSSPL